jgi:hypothetical protein
VLAAVAGVHSFDEELVSELDGGLEDLAFGFDIDGRPASSFFPTGSIALKSGIGGYGFSLLNQGLSGA